MTSTDCQQIKINTDVFQTTTHRAVIYRTDTGNHVKRTKSKRGTTPTVRKRSSCSCVAVPDHGLLRRGLREGATTSTGGPSLRRSLRARGSSAILPERSGSSAVDYGRVAACRCPVKGGISAARLRDRSTNIHGERRKPAPTPRER